MAKPMQTRLKRLARMWLGSLHVQVGALCATYGLMVTLYVILHYAVGERWQWVGLLNEFAHLLTLLTIPALLICLTVPRYRRIWTAYTLSGVIVAVLWYGPYFMPKLPLPPLPDTPTFTVMTYNTADSPQALHAWNAGVYGADIIGFQELAKVIWRKHYRDRIAAADNKGIHSRYPRVGTETRIIYQDTANEDIAGLRAVYRIEGREVSVYSVHPRRPALGLRPLGYFNQDRERAIRHLVDQVAQDTNPVIVLCDCNFSDRTDAYASLSVHLQDAWAARGFGLGLTAPASGDRGGLPFTLGRPDYIWHSPEFETVSIERVLLPYSDHYAVRATLRFKSSSGE